MAKENGTQPMQTLRQAGLPPNYMMGQGSGMMKGYPGPGMNSRTNMNSLMPSFMDQLLNKMMMYRQGMDRFNNSGYRFGTPISSNTNFFAPPNPPQGTGLKGYFDRNAYMNKYNAGEL